MLICVAVRRKFEIKRNSFATFQQQTNRKTTPEILHFHLCLILPWVASVTSYLSENEAENLQNGDFFLAQIPDFEMRYLRNHLAH